MDWDKLADNRCPRCASRLFEPTGFLDEARTCENSHCLFKINTDKFEKIVADTNAKRRRMQDHYNPDENLSALNNL